MENTLFAPIGLSGSGKSFYFKNKFLYDFPDVAEKLDQLGLSVSDITACPDLIRKEIFGDINKGHTGYDAFTAWKIAEDRVRKYLNEYGFAIIDGVNVHGGGRNKFIKNFNVYKVAIVFRPDVDLSFKRIQKDIENSVERVDVSFEVILRQLDNFKRSVVGNSEWDGLWNQKIKKQIATKLSTHFDRIEFIN